MSAVPELKSELNRKAFEAIEFLIQKLNAGAITPHQFGTGVDVLWTTASGLIDETIIDLITAAGNEAPKGAPMEKRVFIKARETIVVERAVGDDFIYVKSYFDDAMTNTKRKDCGSSAATRDAIISTAAKLLGAGYTEL